MGLKSTKIKPHKITRSPWLESENQTQYACMDLPESIKQPLQSMGARYFRADMHRAGVHWKRQHDPWLQEVAGGVGRQMALIMEVIVCGCGLCFYGAGSYFRHEKVGS